MASQNDHLEVVKHLLEKGATVDAFFFFSPSARRSSRYAIPNMGVSRKSPQEQREW